MSKIHNNIPEHLLQQLSQLGYRALKAEDYHIFAPYYDAINGHYASALSFPCLLAWSDAIPIFYKPIGGQTEGSLLACLQYDGTIGIWTALPFIGHYSKEGVENAFRVLHADMEALRFPLYVVDMSEWMVPYYQGVGDILWNIKKPREWMDYIYQRADFEKSLNRSDSLYRRRYFLRKFSPETVVLTSAHKEECLDCLRAVWCPGRDCADCFACPVDAVSNVVGALDNLRADGILVRVDGKPAGFCVVSCRNGMGCYHFKHADNRMKGINEYLLSECFTRFLSGAEEINFTEDIGKEGLRAYKRKLAPYTLSPRMTLRGTVKDNKERIAVFHNGTEKSDRRRMAFRL